MFSTPSAHTGPGALRRRRERRLLALALLALGALLAWGRVAERRDIAAQERLRLQAQARAVDENLAGQIDGAYAALVNVRDDLPDWPAGDRTARARQRLVALCAAMPGVSTMSWLGPQGLILASNRPELVGADESAQAYFTQVQHDPDPHVLYVSEPFRNRAGEYSLSLSVALPGPQGAFGGTVAATLDPKYFASLLGSVLYAPDMWAAVVHGDGTLVVVNPQNVRAQGMNLARPDTLFTRHLASARQASVQEGPTIEGERGVTRLVAFRTMQFPRLPMNHPLVLAVSRDESALFAPWRQAGLGYAALYLGGAAAAWLALRASQRRRSEFDRLAAEQRARESAEAERLALALRGADLALWDAHLPSGTGTVNERWYGMLGLAPGDVGTTEEAWLALLHPEDRDRVVASQRAHVEGRSPSYEQVYRMRHRDGHWVWVLDRGRVVERDASGRAIRMVGTHMDISDSMQAQETLRLSEQSLATTLHSIGDAVIATDPQGRVTRLNATAERLTGWGLAEAVGQPLAMIFRIYNARTREPVLDPVALVLERGEVVGLANDTVLVARDGSERQIADSAAPIRGASGDTEGVVLVFSDVSEHYRMLQALRDSESQLATIAAALPGPVSRLDCQGRYLFANAAYERWFGVPVAQMIGRDCSDVVGREAHAAIEPWRLRALGGETVTFDLAVQTREGPRDTMVTIVPDRSGEGADGGVRGCFLVTTDISARKRAEEALRQSERKTRALFDALRSGVVVHAADTSVLDANPAACSILGLSPDQMRGRVAIDPAWCFIDADHTPMAPPSYPVNRVRESGLPLKNLLAGVMRPDRETPTWVLCNAFPLHGVDGALQEIVVTLADITERKLAEEELQRSEARLRMATRLARLGGWRLEVLRPALHFAPELCAMLGIDVSEVPDAAAGYDFVVPEHRGRWRERLAQCIRDGLPFDDEVDALTAGGQRLHLRVMGEALRDSAGRTLALQGTVQDITERKRADAAMRAAQQELAATLDAVPDLLFDIDMLGCIHAYHSPRNDLPGMTPADLIGRRIEEILPGEAAAVVRRAMAEAARDGHSGGLEYELDRPDGRHWFDLSVSPKPVPEGSMARFIVLARDVSERRHAEADRRALERQLREAQKMESIGTLAGGIAHDFNNILAAILGNAALANDDLPAGHPARTSIEQISRAGQRARALVQQILTFSRRQINPLLTQPLRPIIDETLGLLRATLPASVRLDIELPDEPLFVEADATQLQQVLMNLCMNAWQALPEGRGRIEVGCQTQAGAPGVPALHELSAGPVVHLWVRDDGVGMDAATRDRVFDPFFTTKPVGKGTGLGLSVAHGIVQAHRGLIEVDSEPGRGSTFHLYLRRVSATDAARVPAAGAAPAAVPAQVGELLYVDDDDVMLMMVQRLLQRDGWAVAVCGDATQALAMVRERPGRFELVVTDFNMPGASGLELAAQLARVEPTLPLVVSSGYITEELRQQAAALGVRALLQKERTLEELPVLVRKVLAR